MTLTRRPRRLRSDGVRPLVSETSLDPTDLVAPVFVDATTDERRPIESMPGHERVPVDEAVPRVEEILETGVEAIILFGIPESKDSEGSRAWAEDGVVQRATRQITAETDAYVVTDVCLCEYTDHGHCGSLEDDAREDSRMTVDNDRTLDLLRRTAVSQAEAGAEMVAPSSMTDGMVGAVREGLDEQGFESVAVMSYAAKYESAFYGPFRDAADGAPAFGDRRHYQMDPANAAAEKGWLDLEEVAHESLLSIKRAGADLVITYFAEDVARKL